MARPHHESKRGNSKVYCPASRGAVNLYPIESVHEYGGRTAIMSSELPGVITEAELIELLKSSAKRAGRDMCRATFSNNHNYI